MPEIPPPGEVRSRPPAPRWAMIAVLQAFILIAAGSLIHVPMHSLAPGQTLDVLSAIEFEGARARPSEGELLLTTASVSTAPLTVWEGLWVWLDPGITTIPRSYYVPPWSSDEEEDVTNRHDIEESKLVAMVAAFRALGHEVPALPGVGVVSVIDDLPADGRLEPRDRIVAVDGREVETRDAFSRELDRRAPGDEVALTVERGGRMRQVRLETAGVDGRAFIGVTLGPAYRFPNNVDIDSAEVVGPSGGLVFALSIADAFGRIDLTHGHTVGVTGTIALDEESGQGLVGPIGAVQEKVRGAYRDGATVFVVPAIEAAEAEAAAPEDMTVIGVETLAQAIAALRDLPPVA